jgi:hypothetical protein
MATPGAKPRIESDALAGPQFSNTIDFEVLRDLGMSADEYARFADEDKATSPVHINGKRRRNDTEHCELAHLKCSRPLPDVAKTDTRTPHAPLPITIFAPSASEKCSTFLTFASPLVPACEFRSSRVPELDTELSSTSAIKEYPEFELEAVVSQICSVLLEDNQISVRLAVQALGLHAARRLRDETLKIEVSRRAGFFFSVQSLQEVLYYCCAALQDEGGLFTADGERRRSPGGVFFELLKGRVDKDTFKNIFAHQTKARTQRLNARRQRDRAFRSISLGVAPTAGAMHGFK